MAKDKELADHERAHNGQPGSEVRHGADATGNPGNGSFARKIVGHRIHDNVEGRYVSALYKAGPTRANAKRARARAENMNMEWGAHRYSSHPVFDDSSSD